MKKLFCLFLLVLLVSCDKKETILPDDYPPPPNKIRDAKDSIAVKPSDFEIGNRA
jgi:hypothetical protein